MNLYRSSIALALLLVTTAFAEYKSQVGQDKFVHEHFFMNKKNGIFVDIGAHDGITFSNSYFFEKECNWSGICFEPRTELFKKLKSCRNCICINACVSDQTGMVPFINIESVDEMLSGMVTTYDQRQLDIVMNDLKIYGGECNTIALPCVVLQDVLDEYGIKHIDFLSVDTEGGELEIIKTIDFSRVTIDVITVENNYAEQPMRDLLASKGFILSHRIHPDDIFVHKDFIINKRSGV